MHRLFAILISTIIGTAFSGAGIFIALQTAVPTYMMWAKTRDWQPVEAELISVNGTESSTAASYRYFIKNKTYLGNRVYLADFNDNIGSYHADLRQSLQKELYKKAPITVWVDPLKPSNSIIDRSMRWGLFALMSGFCLSFFLIGLFVILAVLTSKRRAKTTQKSSYGITRLNAQEAFQTRKGWESNIIRSGAKSSILFFWIFAIFWNAISYIAAFAALDDILNGNYGALIVILFPLVGLFLLSIASKKTLEYKRFGIVELCMDPYPGSIGGHLGGTIALTNLSSDHLASTFEIEAQCIYTYVSGSGKNRSRKERILWAEKGNGRTSMLAKGILLEFRFDVPDDLPESDIQQQGAYNFWRINVKADLPGVDLNRSYNIPVFKTGEQSRNVQHDISDQVEQQNRIDDEKEAAAIARQDFDGAGLGKVVRIKSDGRNLRMVFPMFRNKALAIFALIFGVSFGGATIATLPNLSSFSLFDLGGILFSLPFAAIGIIGLTSGIYLLFNRLHVSAKEGHITILRTLFILPVFYKKIDKYQVKKFSIKKGMSSGQGTSKTEFFKIKIHDQTGKTFIIAEGIPGENLSEHFKDYIEQRIRMC